MSERARAPLAFDDGYLGLPELATYSGLSVHTLREHLKGEPPLPHYRIGGRIMVKRSEYDAWAEQFHRRGTPSLTAFARKMLATR